MAKGIVLRGADIKLYVNGQLFNSCQNVTYTIDYGEQEIFGIDSAFPQEIAITKVTVIGNVSGVIVKGSGGLQGMGVTESAGDILESPYISLRIQDRDTLEDLLYIGQARVTNERVTIASKGIGELSFGFKGIFAWQGKDMA